METVNCDICGYDMKGDDGKIHVGLNIFMPPESREGMHLTDVFGRHNFKICCACMIKSAGVKTADEIEEAERIGQLPTKELEAPVETPAGAILNAPPKRKAGRPPKAKSEAKPEEKPESLNDVINNIREREAAEVG